MAQQFQNQDEQIQYELLNGSTTLLGQERQPCEIFSRVMGYYRPVDYWNIGKKQEFEDRKYYKETE